MNSTAWMIIVADPQTKCEIKNCSGVPPAESVRFQIPLRRSSINLSDVMNDDIANKELQKVVFDLSRPFF